MYQFEISLRDALKVSNFINDSMFKSYVCWTSTNTFICDDIDVVADLDAELEYSGYEFTITQSNPSFLPVIL